MRTLRDYQEEDVTKLQTLLAMGCFNEQRTGKTPTAISALHREGYDRPLIVCPASAIPQWADEYVNWTGEPALQIIGTKAQKEKLFADYKSGAIIISYDTLKETNSREGFINTILRINPNAVIADEAHRFKSHTSKVFKAMQKLMRIPRRLALTGTPASGKPEQIYGILYWLAPHYTGTYNQFCNKFFYTRLVAMNGRRFVDVGHFLPGKERELQLFLNRISTQRKRKEVMQWLPAKDRIDIKLSLTREQIKYLGELAKYFETEHIVTQGMLDRLIRYRQICLAPELLGLRSASPKINWIIDYLNDYPDTPVIIFSKFTSFLELLQNKLEKNKKEFVPMIIGKTSIQQRAEYVKDFQSGKHNLLLINVDAGKEALTLDRAEAMIFTDIYPPASDIQQAEDRFVSTTEARADKPHKIYRLMMKDSYDEQVYKLVDEQASLTDLLNDYKKYLGRG